MKNLTRIKVNIFWALILFGLSGCYTIEMANQMTSTPLTPNLGTTTSTIAPESTKGIETTTITPVPLPTCHTQICKDSPTPMPTVLPIVKQQFYKLVANNGNCELPCLLGITPGLSNWKQVTDILRPYVYNHFGNEEDALGLRTERRLIHPIIFSWTPEVPLDLEMHFKFDIDKNDFVHTILMVAYWSYDGEAEFYDTHFKKFGIRNVFLEFGKPDRIYLSQYRAGYGLTVIYDSMNMVINYSGASDLTSNVQPMVCPNIGDGQVTFFSIGITDSETTPEWGKIFGVPIDDDPTLGERTGISIDEFYNLIIAEQQPACIKAKYWYEN